MEGKTWPITKKNKKQFEDSKTGRVKKKINEKQK